MNAISKAVLGEQKSNIEFAGTTEFQDYVPEQVALLANYRLKNVNLTRSLSYALIGLINNERIPRPERSILYAMRILLRPMESGIRDEKDFADAEIVEDT